MRKAREVAGAGVEFGMVAWKEQNLLMAQGPVREFGFRKKWPAQYVEAVAWQEQVPGRWVFILDEAMGDCVDKSKATFVANANRRQWWMFQAHARVPGCVPALPVDEDAKGDAADDDGAG
jgi:hypothetical protein